MTNIKEFYDWWTTQKQYRDLVKYLEYLKNSVNYPDGLDKKALSMYYVEQNVVFIKDDPKAVEEIINLDDQKFKEKYKAKGGSIKKTYMK